MPLSDTEQKELYWLEVFEALLQIYETSQDEANQNRAKQIAWLLDYKLNLGQPVNAIFNLAETEGPVSSSQYKDTFQEALARLEELRKKA